MVSGWYVQHSDKSQFKIQDMKFTIICLMLLCGVSGMAQNNAIFKGGNGDGCHYQLFQQPANNIYGGGSGDGWAIADYAQEGNNIYNGGIGDGWAKDTSALTVLSVADLSLNSPIKVYPNPASDSLVIDSPASILTTKIYDLNGRCINTVSGENIVNVAYLAAGTYLLVIETSDGIAIKKIVKK